MFWNLTFKFLYFEPAVGACPMLARTGGQAGFAKLCGLATYRFLKPHGLITITP